MSRAERVSTFRCNQQDDFEGEATIVQQGLDNRGFTRQRIDECSGRRSISSGPHLDRMVSRPKIIPLGVQEDIAPSDGGPVRHHGELSTAHICSPLSDGRGSRDRLSSHRLEPVGVSLPVSPSPAGFEGFEKAGNLFRSSSTRHSGLATQTLVLQSQATVSHLHSIRGPDSVTKGWRYNFLRAALFDREISRLDFLRLSHGSDLSPEVLAYLLSYLRTSSSRQYESVWNKLRNYVRLTKPELIDFNFVGKFLIYLFEKEKFEANTIKSYLAAIKEPLTLAFGISLDEGRVSQLLRSFGSRSLG